MDEKQIKLLADSLARSMTSSMQTLLRQQNQGSGRAPSPGSGGKSTTDKHSKSVEENMDALDDHTQAIEDYSDRMKSSGKTVTGAMKIQAMAVGKSLKSLELGVAGSSRSLDNLLTQSTALSKALMDNSGAFQNMSNESLDAFSKKLNKTVRTMTESNALLSGVLDNTSTNKAKAFQDNLIKLSLVSKMAGEALEQASVSRLADLDSSDKSNALIRTQIIPNYKKLGLVTSQLEKDLLSTDKAVRKSALAQLDNAANVARNTVANATNTVGTKASLLSLQKTLASATAGLTGMGYEMNMMTAAFASTGGALALIGKGVKGLYEQFRTLGAQGLGGAVLDFNKLSFSTLMSVSALGELVTANKQLMGRDGMAGFTRAMKFNADKMRANGMSTEEASKANIAHAQILSEVGIRESDPKFYSALAKQQDTFLELRAATGITIEGFNSLQQELINSQDMQTALARVSVGERSAKLANITLEAKRLSQLGVTIEQTKKIIAANDAILGQTVKNRLTDSAKVQQAASLVGKGAEGAELAQLIRKGSRTTNEEKSRMNDLAASIGKNMDTMSDRGLAAENMMDNIREGFSGATTTLFNSARDIRFASENQKGISKDALELNKKMQESDIGGFATKFVDTAKVFIGNPLVEIGVGVTGLLAAIWFGNKAMKAVSVSTQALPEIREAVVNQTKQTVAQSNQVENAVMNGNNLLKQISVSVRQISGNLGGKGMKAAGAAGSGSINGTGRNTPDMPDMRTGSDTTHTRTSTASGAKPKGKFGKIMGAAGGIFGKLGSFALKAAPALAVLNGIMDGAAGWMDAGQTFATNAPTMGQKISGALGGVLSGLTFGLLSGEDIARGLYDSAGWIGEKLTATFNFFKDVFEIYIMNYIKAIGKVVGFVKGIFGADENNAISDYAKEKEKDHEIASKARDADLANSKAQRLANKKNRDAATEATATTKEATAALDTLHKTTFDALSGSSLVNEVAMAQAQVVKPATDTSSRSSSSAAINSNTKTDDKGSTDSSKITTVTPNAALSGDPATLLQSILLKMTELVDINTEIKTVETDQLRQMKFGGNYAQSKSMILSNA